MDKTSNSFPMLPVAHWWTLRNKFKQSLPGVVTDSYLATVLNMTVGSARANVLAFLKPLGIIDDEGKTTERAKLWRDDARYAEVCKAILHEVYPEELLEVAPDPKSDREAAKRWFAHQTGAGESAVGRMSGLYAVLADGIVIAPSPSKTAKSSTKPVKQSPAKSHSQKKLLCPRKLLKMKFKDLV